MHAFHSGQSNVSSLLGRRKKPGRLQGRHSPWGGIEPLESRIAPASVTTGGVSKDSDPAKGDFVGKDGVESLYEAILEVNKKGGGEITFAVPTVTVSEALPSITAKVTIRGMAGGGGGPGTTLTGSGVAGLVLSKGGSVTNLAINGFTGTGLTINGGGMVSNCYVGTDLAGAAAKPNTEAGISASGGSITIMDCVISGNGGDGLEMDAGGKITDCMIGTDKAGKADLGNGAEGISVGAPGVTIMDCVICSNHNDGVGIDGSNVTGVKVQGNKIGVDVTGLSALPNGFGVFIGSGAHKNLVGGTTADQRNVISANTSDGIIIELSSGNTVEGNYLGVGADGSTKLGNGDKGVEIHGGAGNIIGGTSAAARNIIAGNKTGVSIASFTGVHFAGSTGTGNIVEGNYLGLDVNGAKFGNSEAGVSLSDHAVKNIVGGASAAARNIIAASTDGVTIKDSSSNLILGNYIGTGTMGTESGYSNDTGVHISGQSTENVIGGKTAAARNIISGNATDGVSIETGADTNIVAGNYLGTDVSGGFSLPNDGNGISINGDSNVVTGNIISGNSTGGVGIDSGDSNQIVGNLIGIDLSGAILANGGDGVSIGGSKNAVKLNLISGNNGDGVHVDMGDSNSIQANHIGTDATGSSALPNTGNGVTVDGQLNAVGLNFIGGNFGNGVAIDGGTGNIILSNSIGINAKGMSALKNQMNGVTIKGSQTSVSKNIISGNTGDGISLEMGGQATIVGNYIGTGAKGKGVVANLGDGIHAVGSNGNIIGGVLPLDRNIVGNNIGDGVHLENSSGAMILGNSIGADLTGKVNLANGGDGVHLEGSTLNTIGGAEKGSGNVIDWNSGDGIHLEATSNGNLIEGNLIGADLTEKLARPNLGEGIHLEKSDGNTLGGINKGEGNLIALNKKNGILFDDGKNNIIQGSSIVSNGDLGISLINNANLGQVAPAIATAGKVAGKFTVTGNLTGATSASVTLDLYSNAVADPTNAGEGQTFLGEVTVTTDAAGNFTAVFPTAPAAGAFLSLTVREANGTSAFSTDKKV